MIKHEEFSFIPIFVHDENFYDENKKCYVRNKEDKKMDISILGAIVPFKVFTTKRH